MGCMKGAKDEQDAPSVCLTCSEGCEDDPVVERLCGAVVVLQQHPVCILSFTGVKYRLHLQQLQWRGEERGQGGDTNGKKHLRSGGIKLKTESGTFSLTVKSKFI